VETADDLIARLREGDEAAFEALVARHHAAFRRVALTFVRTSAAADEVVQETWLAVIRGLDRFEGRSSLRTWMFGILVNQARTRATQDSRCVPFSAIADDGQPTVEPTAVNADRRWRSAPQRIELDPEANLLNGELRASLLRAVEALPSGQRAVITLRDLFGLDAGAVCALLGVSDGNQRVLLHRARARVRLALQSLR